MKKILTLIFAIAATGLAVSSCSSGASSPGEAAKQYAGYLAEGKYDKFVDACYYPADTPSDELKEQRAGMKSLLTEKVDESLEENGGITSVEVLSETIAADGQSAYVELRYTYGNGETDDNDMDLVLHDGRWLMEINK